MVCLLSVACYERWPVGKVILVKTALHFFTVDIESRVVGDGISAGDSFADVSILTPVHPGIAIHELGKSRYFSHAVITVIRYDSPIANTGALLRCHEHYTVSAARSVYRC